MKVLVTGATSMIGDYLLPMLVDAGHELIATSRKSHPDGKGIHWVKADLRNLEWAEQIGQVDVWINFTSLKLLADLLDRAGAKLNPQRIIAFSSTSRYTKSDARGSHDRGIASELASGESRLEELCREMDIAWTIFRPTLIYSLGRDKNITLISNKIRQLHFFPMVGSGKGLRQPVHAEDLAKACVLALGSSASFNKAYNLSGAEILSYRDMVVRLFDKLGIKPHFVQLPLSFFRLAIRLLRLVPKYSYLTPDMADRMEKDMVFPHEEASRDFGYSPRKFEP